MTKIVIHALEEKKANDIHVIEVSEVTSVADYFIIANGNNRNQVQALIDSVEEALEKVQCHVKQIEGYDSANWILMDYGDIIVHVFDQENRLLYNLEKMWRDGTQMELSDFS
ncbi:MAG: ribosome silencing factor [Eubacteriales bacterium]